MNDPSTSPKSPWSIAGGQERTPLIHLLLLAVTFGFMAAHAGWIYAVSLLVILGAHEMGHYVACRLYGVEATLPYFLPSPFYFGTFGAFIKIKSPIPDRKALFDIGAAGPIAGFIPAVIALVVGTILSEPAGVLPPGGYLIFGDSLFVKGVTLLIHGTWNTEHLQLHPLGMAGWLGLFVTAMNLIPVGQLDGGHIAYALWGDESRRIGSIALLAVFLLSFGWFGWFVWGGLLFFVLGNWHPPTSYDYVELDSRRRMLGKLCFLILLLTFIPVPFEFETFEEAVRQTIKV